MTYSIERSEDGRTNTITLGEDMTLEEAFQAGYRLGREDGRRAGRDELKRELLTAGNPNERHAALMRDGETRFGGPVGIDRGDPERD